MTLTANETIRVMLRAYVNSIALGRGDNVLASNLFLAIWNVLTLGDATSARQQAMVYNLAHDTVNRHVKIFRESLKAAFRDEDVDALAFFTDSEVDLNVMAGGRAA